jgi:signal transduction histidine kinase/DNA-binding LacI/PurR family transcriptional regulator/AraC-like DNA-binding protein
MSQKVRARPTIGFISTWSVYEGTTIDNYTHTLLLGVCDAAREHDCNLLIGCGISLPGSPRASRTAWAVPGENVDFVPVGPWNVDGLIIIPDDLSDAQFEYIQDLIRSGYPVILTTAEKPGPLVAPDNAGGIRQAFHHLLEHGHRQIALIAGKTGRGGDSAERLSAYRAALNEAGIAEDERLIAFGEHRREGGRIAMQRILATGVPFTALIASNDLSGLGAMDTLRDAGRRIPEDVAVIGFDDILEARSQLPPLTTIRHPTFMLGRQAALALLDAIRGQATQGTSIRVKTQLVVRQSCGCRLDNPLVASLDPAYPLELESLQAALARVMAEATLIEVQHSSREKIEALCLSLTTAFAASLVDHDPTRFERALQGLIQWLETHGEDAYAWHAALSTLRRALPNLLAAVPGAQPGFADMLVDRARVVIAELTQRQATNVLLHHTEMSNRLGLMTSQLLAAFDTTATADILAQHLPQLGIEHVLVALYSAHEDDPLSHSIVLLGAGLPASGVGRPFLTREFPPPGLYPPDSAFQLAILPLVIDERPTGFVALSASNLEPCAAIVHNLASALRTGQLYHDALEGRRLAEEANRLKSRFLSTVSHELRTPLSLIVGLSEMVLRERPEPSDTMLRDIEQINISAQHLARLIGDVLDLASSEAGQLRILHEPLNLAEVLAVTAQIGEQMAREKGLKWSAQLAPQGPWVLGDRTRLRQITLNLISNAVKFTSSGQVALTCGQAGAGQQVVISVSDTGIGITPSEQEAIFREFHRSKRTIQSGFSGLGLGLAISKQLVEQHGGSIGVRSPGDLGRGSTFFFSLPVIAATALPTDLASRLVPRSNSVLVLTERLEPADKLCNYLRQRGFDLRVCNVDEETGWLADVVASPPAAFILGNRLASREGWAIIGMLKQQPVTEYIPIWAYSLDIEHDQGELLELNYRQKPLPAEQLAEELARYFEPSLDQRTVLIVDDDPGILDLHSRLVKQLGCQPITARNGREALEVVEHTPLDLILLDLTMPEMDGFSVLDVLRSREATRNIPVIVLTARLLSDADLERCNRGVATILGKGLFNATETLHHIETALTRQHTLGRATQQLVRQAAACIQAHYAEALTREDIAHQVGINADYLTDCFRQELGITPMTYLRRYRIRQARELLETSDLSIMQVALEAGFSESAHFTRTFQREVGMTPRAYRDSKRG